MTTNPSRGLEQSENNPANSIHGQLLLKSLQWGWLVIPFLEEEVPPHRGGEWEVIQPEITYPTSVTRSVPQLVQLESIYLAVHVSSDPRPYIQPT